MSRDYRVGVIGCGFIATEAHLPALVASERLTIAAIADLSPERLRNYELRLGRHVDAYNDYRELLARGDIDLIIAAVPPGARAAVVLDAIAAGKDVICEKPIAATLSDAKGMVAAADAAGTILGVFNNFLFFPEVAAASEMLAEGVIGQVRLASIDAIGLGMDVEAFEDYPGSVQHWKHDPTTAGGGVLMDYGPHAAYLMDLLMGARPLATTAFIDRLGSHDSAVEDYSFAHFEYPAGHGFVQLSWHPAMASEARSLQSGGVKLVGDRGTLEFIYRGRGEAPHTAVEKVVVRTATEEFVRLIPFAETKAKLIASFRDNLADFVGGVDNRTAPRSDGAMGIRSLESVLACYQSALLGRRCEFPIAEASPVHDHGVLGLVAIGRLPTTGETLEGLRA